MDHRTRTPRWLVSRVGAGVVLCGAVSLGVGALSDWLPHEVAWVALASLAAFSAVCLALLSRRNVKRSPTTSHVTTFARLAADADAATSTGEVVKIVEGAVRDVLHCERVELSLEPGLLNEGFQSGAHLITPKVRAHGPQMSIELTYAGETLGQLCASRSAS